MQALRVRLIQDPFNDVEFRKNPASPSSQFVATSDRRFEFQKRRQLFVRVHNVTLPVAAMCVNSPDRSLALPFLLSNRSLPTLFWNTSSAERWPSSSHSKMAPMAIESSSHFLIDLAQYNLSGIQRPRLAEHLKSNYDQGPKAFGPCHAGAFLGAVGVHRAIGKGGNPSEAVRSWHARFPRRGWCRLPRLWLVAAGLAVGP
jgi:hypothetical protein